jgi:hypothetical protein
MGIITYAKFNLIRFFRSNKDLLNVSFPGEVSSYHAVITTSTDYGRPMKPFSLKSKTFGLGHKSGIYFLGIGGIFAQFISAHFGTVSPLSMFSIIQSLFLQKTLPLYPHPKYLFGTGI